MSVKDLSIVSIGKLEPKNSSAARSKLVTEEHSISSVISMSEIMNQHGYCLLDCGLIL